VETTTAALQLLQNSLECTCTFKNASFNISAALSKSVDVFKMPVGDRTFLRIPFYF